MPCICGRDDLEAFIHLREGRIVSNRIEDQIRKIIPDKSVSPEDIPDIGLYMDQVTTLMENKLKGGKRYPEDKIMTKTMINNYTKNHLLPPSDKKKYSRGHVLLILMIYYLKNMLSITDIKTVLGPLNNEFFDSSGNRGLSLEDIYARIAESYDDRRDETIRQLSEMVESSHGRFSSPDLTDKDRRYLDDLSVICSLGYDIYIRKRLMEQIIDNYKEDYPPLDKKQKKSS